MFGEVTRALLPRGFAFVIGDDGQDYFLHVDQWEGTWDGQNMKRGTRVEFVPKKMPDGKLRANSARPYDDLGRQ